MTVYTVRKANGTFVCGPFRDKAHAEEMAESYSGSWLWGACHVEAKEVDD